MVMEIFRSIASDFLSVFSPRFHNPPQAPRLLDFKNPDRRIFANDTTQPQLKWGGWNHQQTIGSDFFGVIQHIFANDRYYPSF